MTGNRGGNQWKRANCVSANAKVKSAQRTNPVRLYVPLLENDLRQAKTRPPRSHSKPAREENATGFAPMQIASSTELVLEPTLEKETFNNLLICYTYPQFLSHIATASPGAIFNQREHIVLCERDSPSIKRFIIYLQNHDEVILLHDYRLVFPIK